ncbi:DUF6266 family protein [Carboxylicivirga marina]|uniref:Uncharacterized protein n=1 Tax=Carboxylicivirga marina TaxID=2800988 RepID=A0ABS1HK16_9BACT|nr:DUF6266 family protein [Carboxylicivirga marina]MBK3518019.1 hypothetical protein [Carboxylicivirga marina]
MARYNSINEGSSGKVGNVVTYKMYGKSYMRSMPGQYTDKKSEKQLAQRQKMQLVNDFLGAFTNVLRITFQKEAVGRSAYAAAKSYNLLHAIGGEYPEQYIDFTKALVSIGSVILPSNLSVKRINNGLLFNWENDEFGNLSDTLFVTVKGRSKQYVEYKQTEAQRKDESYTWKMDFTENEQYDVWLIFRDYKERGFSKSVWLGLV